MKLSILQTFGWFTLLTLISSIPQPATAQPITPAADGTNTLVTPNGQRYDIDGGTLSRDGANLFHSFQQFGLDPGQTANFISNPQIQNILGRVVGGDPSIINGLIQITGGNSNLFLMNPAGILFGPNASLNIPADFTATTASGIGFSNGWFNAFGSNDYANLVGTPSAFSFNMSQLGTIINEGNLTLTNGSNLNLFANTVINTGTLATPGGNINITAVPNGNILRISQPGHILSLEIIPNANNNQSLPQLLTGGDPIHHATTVQKLDDGTIRLSGSQTPIPLEPGVAVVSGNVDVGGLKPNYELNILGDKIALIGANIDASGTNGAGNIHIGGNYQGAGPLPNATHTYIDTNTNITANAISGGSGGEIIIWSDNTTQFHGNISATGIENGGFVEVSGKQNLIFRGNVDLSAPNGQTGTLLLDPENITIVDGSGGANDSQLSDNQILFGDAGTTFTISETKLESIDGNAAVELQATNNITIEDLTDNELSFKAGTGAITFTADADNDSNGNFTMNSGDSIIAPGRPVTINAASITLGNIDSSTDNDGGYIRITADKNIDFNSVSTDGFNAGNILVNSRNGSIVGNTLSTKNDSPQGNAGDINVTAAGDIQLRSISADSYYGISGSGGDVTISTSGGSLSIGAIGTSSVLEGVGGNVSLTAFGTIDANTIDSSGDLQGGNISLTSTNSSITIINGSLVSNSANGTGGDINLSASGAILSGNIDASGASGGGDITLTSTWGDIDTSGGQLKADSPNGTNGNIAINAYTGSIIVGELTGSQNINIINGGTDNPLGNNPAATVDADADTINRQSGQVSLQAHNDLTVSEPIVTSSISSLELKAGRNININADIDTSGSNGNITLQGNDNGANPTYRQPGAGNIIMAPGTNINAGSGDILIQLGTLAEAGKITLANLDTTGSVNVIAPGGNIQAADSGSMITANTASLITYENGGIGTPDEPLAITVNNLSAQAGSSGAFFNSPHQGVTVGGANGQIFGISTSGGGDIGVSALGNITVSEDISTQVGEGNAGKITLTSTEGSINSLDSKISSYSNQGNGGDVTLTASGDISTNSIESYGLSTGGQITITSSSGGIDVGDISSVSQTGNAGFVTLTADRDIKTRNISSDTQSISWDAATNTYKYGNGGNVTITSRGGSIDITAGMVSASANAYFGNGGDVSLTAAGDIRADRIQSTSPDGNGGDVSLSAAGDIHNNIIYAYSSSGTGNAGNVSLSAAGDIHNGIIESYSFSGIAGNVNLSAAGDIHNDTIRSQSSSGTGGTVNLSAAGYIDTGIIESYSQGSGAGGNITITSSGGAIDATGNLGSYAALGHGGDVTLKASGPITTTNIYSRSGFESNYVGDDTWQLVVVPNSQGNGGNITIESRNSSIDTSGGHLDSRSTGGGAGHITITANQDITTSRLLSAAEGVAATLQGGDITITSKQGSINTTAGDLSQEVVILATDDAATVDVASIFGQAQANLQAHATAGTGGNVTLEAAGNITTSHISSFGPATSGAISVTSGGNIQTGVLFSFSESGQAGSVTLTGNNGSIATNHISSYGNEMGGDVTITGKSFDIGAATINSYSENGTAGNVTINVDGNFTLGGDAARSGIRSEGAQTGGNISISSNAGTINTRNSEVLSYSEGGTAGNVMLRADGDVATGNIRSQGSQQGGNLSIISFNGAVDTSWGLLSSYSDNGTAGYASLSAFGDVSTGDISSYGYLSGGNISLGSTNGVINSTWGKLESFSPGGDAGAVTLEAPENIATGDIVSEGNNTGGSITITTDGAVDLTNGSLNSYSARGRAGNVTITGKNDISLGGDVDRSAIRSEGYGAGGDITITSIEGNIDTSRGNLDTYSLAGEAGTIILRAGGSVNSAAMTSYGNLASGDVTIQANGGNLTTGEIKTIAPNGTSGTVTLNNFSHNGDIVTANITTEGGTAAGDITVKSTDGAITTENLSSSSSGGDGGDVTLEAEEDITAGDITSSGENNSGDIAVTSNDGSVTTDDIATTANQGDAGDVTVQAENDINTGNISSVAGGNSGDITVNSDSGSVNSGNIATIAQTGASGDVTVGALGDINTGDITSQGALGSGDINLTSVTGQVNTGEVYTNTGTVNITSGADVVNFVSPVNGDLNPNEAMLANPGNPAIANQLAVMNELILTVQNDASMNSSLLPSEKVFSQETLSSSASQELLASLKVMNSSPLAMNAESAVLALEKSRGDEYEAYFGQDFAQDLQSTVSIREALGKIAAETGYQSAIIYVMAQPDQLELIVVTGSGQPIRKTVPDAPRDKVLATVEEFRNKLTSSFRTNSQTYLPSAQQLYQWLITPIEAELQAAGINTLLFSMDGGLRTVPMAALHDGHQFLVEKYSMSLIPSVSLIDTRYRHLKDTRVLAMGASVFEDLAPLPAVPVELSAVTEDLWQGEGFLNEEFTRDNLVQQRRQNPYPMIHLATHAEFKPGAPENSYIQLWGEEQLRLDELRELGWQNPAVELLVLSACRTALGDEQAEMGFAGLAVQAGVKSALASLWYVSDEGTLALMTEFYRHLEGAKIKGEALRQAQLAMIRGEVAVSSGTLRNDGVASLLPLPPELEQVENTNLSHPYYWSAFTMIGSPW